MAGEPVPLKEIHRHWLLEPQCPVVPTPLPYRCVREPPLLRRSGRQAILLSNSSYSVATTESDNPETAAEDNDSDNPESAAEEDNDSDNPETAAEEDSASDVQDIRHAHFLTPVPEADCRPTRRSTETHSATRSSGRRRTQGAS